MALNAVYVGQPSTVAKPENPEPAVQILTPDVQECGQAGQHRRQGRDYQVGGGYGPPPGR